MQKILSIACCILWLAAAIATQLPEDSKPDPEKIIQKLQAEANEKDAKLENLTNERDAKSKAIKTLPPTVLGSVNRALSQTKVCMSEDKVDGECVTGSTDSVTDSTDFGTDQLGEQKFDGPEQNNSFMTVAGPNTSRIDGPPATTNCYPMMVVSGATGLGSCDKCPYLNTLSWVPGYGDRNDAYHKYYVTGHPVDTTTGCGACPHGSHAYEFMDIDAYYSEILARNISKVAGKRVKYVVICRRDIAQKEVLKCLPTMSSQMYANDAPMTCIKQAEVMIENLYNDGTLHNPVKMHPSYGWSRWNVFCKVWKIVTCKDGKCYSAKRVTFNLAKFADGNNRESWGDTALAAYKTPTDNICSAAAASA